MFWKLRPKFSITFALFSSNKLSNSKYVNYRFVNEFASIRKRYGNPMEVITRVTLKMRGDFVSCDEFLKVEKTNRAQRNRYYEWVDHTVHPVSMSFRHKNPSQMWRVSVSLGSYQLRNQFDWASFRWTTSMCVWCNWSLQAKFLFHLNFFRQGFVASVIKIN